MLAKAALPDTCAAREERSTPFARRNVRGVKVLRCIDEGVEMLRSCRIAKVGNSMQVRPKHLRESSAGAKRWRLVVQKLGLRLWFVANATFDRMRTWVRAEISNYNNRRVRGALPVAILLALAVCGYVAGSGFIGTNANISDRESRMSAHSTHSLPRGTTSLTWGMSLEINEPMLPKLKRVEWVPYEVAYKGLGPSLAFQPPHAGLISRTKPTTTIVNHHAEIDFDKTDPVEAARLLRTSALKRPGEGDTPYNALVSVNNGVVKVIAGRSDAYQGAHVTGLNNGTIGVCLLADLSIRKATEAEVQAMALVDALLANRYGINPEGKTDLTVIDPMGIVPKFTKTVDNITDHGSVGFLKSSASDCPASLHAYRETTRRMSAKLLAEQRFRDFANGIGEGAFRAQR